MTWTLNSSNSRHHQSRDQISHKVTRLLKKAEEQVVSLGDLELAVAKDAVLASHRDEVTLVNRYVVHTTGVYNSTLDLISFSSPPHLPAEIPRFLFFHN